MIAAIVVAGGTGERFGRAGGKQLALVAGRPMLAHTLEAFEEAPSVDIVIVVAHPERVEQYRAEAVERLGARKVTAVVAGGETRQASVARGLAEVPDDADIVVVHDGARPLVTASLIERAIEALQSDPSLDGLAVGHPVHDTIKVVGPDGTVLATPDRESLVAVQTPQAFRASALRAAHDQARRRGIRATDDLALVEAHGGTVKVIPGPRDNIKVTVPEDLMLAERLLAAREEGRTHG
jgi:2-C-methyl-D-erythritol 4-phosphate cytidylyltransferase